MLTKLKNVLPIAADHDKHGGGQVVAEGPDHHQHLAGDVVCFPLKISKVCKYYESHYGVKN